MATTLQAEPVDINAPIAQVWDILTNLADYPKWNPFTFRIESSLVVGEPAALYVRMNPKFELIQREIVTSCDYQQQLSWRSNTPALILQANRIQRVTAIDPQRTRYITHETFSGLLEPLVIALYRRDIERGFNAVCRALKTYAESIKTASLR